MKENAAFTVNTVDRHAVAYTLKIRSGCAGGGKGALVQTEKVGTLSTLQDQTLFQPVVFDARGNGDGKIAPTITGDHESRITDYTAVAVDLYNGAVTGDKTASITCRSIGSHSGPQVAERKNFAEKNCMTPWDSQGRRVYNENGIFPSLQAREKAGGNQQTVLIASRESAVRWIVRRLTPTEDEETIERLQEEVLPEGMTAEYAGEFLCTSYCTEKYPHICGTGTGITASGVPVTADLTVAADQGVFPFGTILYIEGIGIRVVQDRGADIQGRHLDVAVAGTHEDALNWDGYGEHRVWIVKEENK